MFDNIILMHAWWTRGVLRPLPRPARLVRRSTAWATLQPGPEPSRLRVGPGEEGAAGQERGRRGRQPVRRSSETVVEACGAAGARSPAGIMPEEEKQVVQAAHPGRRAQPPLYAAVHGASRVRFFYSNIRNYSYIGIRFFLALFMGFVVGTVFVKLGYDQQYADQRISAIFVTLIFVMFTANAYLPDIFFLRPIYFREHGLAACTSPLAFYLGPLRGRHTNRGGRRSCMLTIYRSTSSDNLNSGNHSSAYGLVFPHHARSALGVCVLHLGRGYGSSSCPPTPTRCSPRTSTCR